MIPGHIMEPNQQLAKWVAGNSVHNGATPAEGECCPDFSCCRPELAWPSSRRLVFLLATDQDRQRMLRGQPRKLPLARAP